MDFISISKFVQEIPHIGIGLILTGVFLAVLLVIASEKTDKVSITLAGVLVSILLAVTTNLVDNFSVLYQWIDMHLLITIIGITLILEMVKKSGILEVFILYFLRSIGGSFDLLMSLLALVVFLLSMVISNVLALIIVAQITILIADVAEINVKPILFLELVVANLSGMLTPIASYTAAYVSLEQNWSYLDFLLISLPFVSLMVFLTILITRKYFQSDIEKMKTREKKFGLQIQRLLQTIDPWSFVDSRKEFYRAIIIFAVVTGFLAFGTSLGLSIDIICLGGGMLVLIFFSDHVESFIRSIDWPMLFFLSGIFIMSGLIQITNIPLILNEPVLNLTALSPFLGIIGFSWTLGLLTAIIENIPLIFLLRPLIDLISTQITNPLVVWWAILAAVNITDSVVLISSVKGIFILEMTKRQGMRIGFLEYFRYGGFITLFHLFGMALYVAFLIFLI
ncbi:MAG: hypothetical protein EAX86_10825 [Candidatus Heimdallarchaeota archaeon]|nr:hypothetical protein [Candidatus Heimdallarchaeota archaeon]